MPRAHASSYRTRTLLAPGRRPDPLLLSLHALRNRHLGAPDSPARAAPRLRPQAAAGDGSPARQGDGEFKDSVTGDSNDDEAPVALPPAEPVVPAAPAAPEQRERDTVS